MQAREHTVPAPHSDVVVFPPFIPMTAMIVGVIVQRVLPSLPQLPAPARALGAALLCLGAAGFAWMVVTMKRARTPIHNAKTPTALVEHGPFRYTRNPMYLFGAAGYAGIALVLGNVVSLALLPVVQVVMHHGVVLREEAFLARHFGAAYEHYKTRVPRWL